MVDEPFLLEGQVLLLDPLHGDYQFVSVQGQLLLKVVHSVHQRVAEYVQSILKIQMKNVESILKIQTEKPRESLTILSSNGP